MEEALRLRAKNHGPLAEEWTGPASGAATPDPDPAPYRVHAGHPRVSGRKPGFCPPPSRGPTSLEAPPRPAGADVLSVPAGRRERRTPARGAGPNRDKGVRLGSGCPDLFADPRQPCCPGYPGQRRAADRPADETLGWTLSAQGKNVGRVPRLAKRRAAADPAEATPGPGRTPWGRLGEWTCPPPSEPVPRRSAGPEAARADLRIVLGRPGGELGALSLGTPRP